jgi:hypothetical protein
MFKSQRRIPGPVIFSKLDHYSHQALQYRRILEVGLKFRGVAERKRAQLHSLDAEAFLPLGAEAGKQDRHLSRARGQKLVERGLKGPLSWSPAEESNPSMSVSLRFSLKHCARPSEIMILKELLVHHHNGGSREKTAFYA